RSSREDVLDEDGAGLGAVALPQLLSVDVGGREEERPVHVDQVDGGGRTDQDGAGVGGGGAALRRAASPHVVPGGRAGVGGVQGAGERAIGARVDGLDQGGAGGRAVSLPQLPSVGAVLGREEERPVHVRQVAGRRTGIAGVDVLDQGGTGLGGVAPPQLVAGR